MSGGILQAVIDAIVWILARMDWYKGVLFDFSPRGNAVLLALVFGLLTYLVLFVTMDDTHDTLVELAVDYPVTAPWTRVFIWFSKKSEILPFGITLGGLFVASLFYLGAILTFAAVSLSAYYKLYLAAPETPPNLWLLATTLSVTSLSAFISGFIGRTTAHIRAVAQKSRAEIDERLEKSGGDGTFADLTKIQVGFGIVLPFVLLAGGVVAYFAVPVYGAEDIWWIFSSYVIIVLVTTTLVSLSLHLLVDWATERGRYYWARAMDALSSVVSKGKDFFDGDDGSPERDEKDD